MSTSTPEYDTVIIGGGPAGLTAAQALTRYRHRSLVVESPYPPRNQASRGAHGMIGLDCATPAEVRDRAWRELNHYGLAELRRTTADDVVPLPEGGFRVRLADGTAAWARTVLLATGVRDLHPEGVEGFEECWGRTVIHCPFCIGRENADRSWAVIADDPDYAVMAGTAFRAWSGDVIAIAPLDMDRADQVRRTLQEAGSDLVQGDIARLHHHNGDLHTVELADGTRIARQTLLWPPSQEQVPLVRRLTTTLGLVRDDDGFVTVDATRRTSVPGLYAAGDLTTQWERGAIEAAAAGAAAAGAIHFAGLH
ncbi:NAD(P)/FAD-dependent oxidoreductase [Streptomyces sp. bgisy130]|uniref:NAD(P)/FAD-dependent oxidoreductase n=1 Tax=Streptomyces sp. bgisy130 TaxID=3413788 RepID=UPI003F4A82C9